MRKALSKWKCPDKVSLILPKIPCDLVVDNPTQNTNISPSHEKYEELYALENEDPLPMSPKSSESEEFTLLAQLENSDPKVQIRGYYNLLNIVQEYTLLGNGAPIVLEDGVLNIREQLLKLYRSSDIELLLAIVDFDYLQILLEGNIINVEHLFLPFIIISVTPNQSTAVLTQIQLFFNYMESTCKSEFLLNLLFESLKPSKQRLGIRIKKTSAMMEIEGLTNSKIAEWLNRLIENDNNKEDIDRFFDNNANVRISLHTLSPIIALKNTPENSKIFITSILGRVFKTQPEIFLKTLDTIDYEISESIKKDLNILTNNGHNEDNNIDQKAEPDLNLCKDEDLSLIDKANDSEHYDFDHEDFMNVLFMLNE